MLFSLSSEIWLSKVLQSVSTNSLDLCYISTYQFTSVLTAMFPAYTLGFLSAFVPHENLKVVTH